VLDLGCGAGRHLRALSRRGAVAIGLDLSVALLAEARLFAFAELLRADMRRIPLRSQSVDIVLSMFTSFGYFDSTAEHAALAAEMARVARQEIVLDVPDPDALRLSLVRRSERRLVEGRVLEERWLEEAPLRVCKRTQVLLDGAGGRSESYLERVALFSRAELEAFFAPHGFGLRDAFGAYDGAPHVPGRSARQFFRFTRGA
jgi:SAM-dependent methyltransferase